VTLRTEQVQPTTGQRRLDSIQIMRAAAAGLVVFFHAVNRIKEHPNLGTSRIIGMGALDSFGAIGVDLFFIISGFVMALSVTRLSGPVTAWRFLRLRWARIAPPFLIAGGLYVCLQAFVGPPPFLSWRALANSVFFIPVVDETHYTTPVLGVGWTLSFEFTFYLGVAALVLLGLSRRPEILAAFMVLAVAVGMATDPQHFLLRWVTNPIMLEFVLGIVAYRLWEKRLLNRARLVQWVLGAGAAGFLLYQAAVGFGAFSAAQRILDGTASAERVLMWGLPLFFVFVALLPTAQGPVTAPGQCARRLGESSYSLYLVHPHVLLFLGAVYARVPALGLPLADLLLLFSVAVSVGAGFAFYRWIECPLNEKVRRSNHVARASEATEPVPIAERPAPADAVTESMPTIGTRPGPMDSSVPPPRARRLPAHSSHAAHPSHRLRATPRVPRGRGTTPSDKPVPRSG
jgi:peptidoglycan/LPS O-acetylase OafA/YrhL